MAEALGWRLLDGELVERIAAELHAPPEAVQACDERTESFMERVGLYLSEGFPETLPIPPIPPPLSPDVTARAARRIITLVVEEGPCVIVGHGAQCVLQADARALHALVHAPLPWRADRAAARYGVGRAEAEAMIRRSDADRRAYIREHFQREWLDPALYHLSVDAGRLGVEVAAELIRAATLRPRPAD